MSVCQLSTRDLKNIYNLVARDLCYVQCTITLHYFCMPLHEIAQLFWSIFQQIYWLLTCIRMECRIHPWDKSCLRIPQSASVFFASFFDILFNSQCSDIFCHFGSKSCPCLEQWFSMVLGSRHPCITSVN